MLAARLLGPGPAWRDQEDARVAHAAVNALGRCSEAEAAAWLDPVTAALAAREETAGALQEAGRPPAWLHNTDATCASLYVALTEQPRDGEADAHVGHADVARTALVRVVSSMTPWLVKPRAGRTASAETPGQ